MVQYATPGCQTTFSPGRSTNGIYSSDISGQGSLSAAVPQHTGCQVLHPVAGDRGSYLACGNALDWNMKY